MMIKKIKVIGFDADDTLWSNEPFFRENEEAFCKLLSSFCSPEEVYSKLFEIEIQNLGLYGYGVKAFVLSMIETALALGGDKITPDIIHQIVTLGRNQLEKPVDLLEDVRFVLDKLHQDYKLVVVTKGDLLDQERKLQKSGIEHYFHHIEIVSEKKSKDYVKLLKHLDISIDEFMMVGNSLKSDVLPVIEMGSYGVHIPFHTTWAHEEIDVVISDPRFFEIEKLTQLLEILEEV